MKHIKLNDEVMIRDFGIKGVVIVTRDDGTIVFKKQNMIVEGGRKYIKNLLGAKLGFGAEDRKIDTMKFGTGSSMVSVEDNTITDPITLTNGDLDFVAVPYQIISGDLPDVVEGKYIKDSTSIFYKGINGSWEPIEIKSSGWSENDYQDIDGELFQYVKLMDISSVDDDDLTFKITGRLSGTGTNVTSISELGLFLNGDGEEMFSRLVFDPFPLSKGTTYTVTYYLYF
jgi:hypothetical protein